MGPCLSKSSASDGAAKGGGGGGGGGGGSGNGRGGGMATASQDPTRPRPMRRGSGNRVSFGSHTGHEGVTQSIIAVRATPEMRENLLELHALARESHRDKANASAADFAGGESSGAISYDPGDENGNRRRMSFASVESVRSLGSTVVRRGSDAGVGRVNNIYSAPLQMEAGFVAPVHIKTPRDTAFLRQALEGNFVFSHLGEEELKTLVDAFEKCREKRGKAIITEGETGDYFYVIDDGTVTFRVRGEDVGSAGKGESFGELALLYDGPRAATCVASSSPCVLWKVDQTTFRRILASAALRQEDDARETLRRVPFLAELEDIHLNMMAEALSSYTYRKGELIIRKGEEGKVFYVVKTGRVKVSEIEVGSSRYDDAILGPGDHFGERAILTNEKRAANVTAMEDSEVLCLSGDSFRKVLGDLEHLVRTTEDKRKLMALPVFQKSDIRKNEVDALVARIEDIDFPKDHIFYKETHEVEVPSRALYFIRSGCVTVASMAGELSILTSGGYFGDDNLKPATEGGTIIAKRTAVVDEDCRVGALKLEAIEEVLGCSRHLRSSVTWSDRNVVQMDRSIKLEHLTKHCLLGAGTFGKVWLVSRKVPNSADKKGRPKKEPFALKIQSKRRLLETRQLKGALREKNIMAALSSEFIINLINTFQDDANVYMLLNFVQGGELFTLLHYADKAGDFARILDGSMSEEQAQFYAGGVLEALDHMHQRHIVYRDLKPENVLIGENGYTVLVDMGFAKVVMNKTYTLCGTPLYLAPEVIVSRGHNKAADYWSLAVLIYEMVTETPPFQAPQNDQKQLFQRIISGKFKLHKHFSPELCDILNKLFVIKPADRLGSFAGGAEDIRDHLWYKDFDFNMLAIQMMDAPWKPKIKNAMDASKFDDWSHLEIEEPEKYPLTAREQEEFKSF